MNKEEIKLKLKESISLFEKKSKKSHSNKSEDSDNKNDGDKPRHGEKKSSKHEKEYAGVQRYFDELGSASMVDIMVMTGIEDDKTGTNRSLFRKKVKQIKNKDNGSIYQFSDEELDKVRAAIDSKK
jgi:hypothetical protein